MYDAALAEVEPVRSIRIFLFAVFFMVGCQGSGLSGPDDDPGAALRARIRQSTAAIDDAALLAAGTQTRDWLTYGRSYAEDRFSPLDQIHASNAAQLGLLWSIDLGTNRGIESTPIAVDGVLFATGPWSVVYAIDARRGRLIWTHDPQVPRRYGRIACCDVVNRGVAVYRG